MKAEISGLALLGIYSAVTPASPQQKVQKWKISLKWLAESFHAIPSLNFPEPMLLRMYGIRKLSPTAMRSATMKLQQSSQSENCCTCWCSLIQSPWHFKYQNIHMKVKYTRLQVLWREPNSSSIKVMMMKKLQEI